MPVEDDGLAARCWGLWPTWWPSWPSWSGWRQSRGCWSRDSADAQSWCCPQEGPRMKDYFLWRIFWGVHKGLLTHFQTCEQPPLHSCQRDWNLADDVPSVVALGVVPTQPDNTVQTQFNWTKLNLKLHPSLKKLSRRAVQACSPNLRQPFIFQNFTSAWFSTNQSLNHIFHRLI